MRFFGVAPTPLRLSLPVPAHLRLSTCLSRTCARPTCVVHQRRAPWHASQLQTTCLIMPPNTRRMRMLARPRQGTRTSMR